MKPLLFAALLLPVVAHATSWKEAITDQHLAVSVHGDSRGQLVVQVANRGAAALKLELPAGLVAIGKNSDRIATIRSATLEVPPEQTAEIIVPAVALSGKNGAADQEFTFTSDAVPSLRPLLEYSATQNDLPRVTAQLAALLLNENINFAQWEVFLGRTDASGPHPTPAEMTASLDAVALTHKLAPDRKFAFVDDGDFRLRAIRNPASRAKAMRLFGLAAPEGVPVPDLNQLLHTAPGDNCPICRMRAQAAEPSNGL